MYISNHAGVRLISVVVVVVFIPTQVQGDGIREKKIQKTKPINYCYTAPVARLGGVEMWVTLARTMSLSFRLQSASDLSPKRQYHTPIIWVL